MSYKNQLENNFFYFFQCQQQLTRSFMNQPIQFQFIFLHNKVEFESFLCIFELFQTPSKEDIPRMMESAFLKQPLINSTMKKKTFFFQSIYI